MKKIYEIIIKTIIGLVSIFLILGLGINYFANKQGKVRKGESFCNENKYSIGNAYSNDMVYFCNNETQGKCLNGIIENEYLNDNNDLYLTFNLFPFNGKTESEINDMLNVDDSRGGVYNIFTDYGIEKYYAKSYEEIKRYLKLDYKTCNLDFYSIEDLEEISDNEKNIFINLN